MREELIKKIGARKAFETINRLSEVVKRHGGVFDFLAFVVDPNSLKENHEFSEIDREFARISVSVLHEMGGKYYDWADRLVDEIENNKIGETTMSEKILITNEEKLDFIIKYLGLTNVEIIKKFGLLNILDILKIRNNLNLIHLYAFESAYGIPYKIFEDKNIKTEKQILKILKNKDGYSPVQKPKIFFTFSARADIAVTNSIKELINNEFSRELQLISWDSSKEIASSPFQDMDVSEYFICYLSEKDEDDLYYLDNSNVLFELGYFIGKDKGMSLNNILIVRESQSKCVGYISFYINGFYRLDVPRNNLFDKNSFLDILNMRVKAILS